MSREFVPRPYQHQIVDHIIRVPRCAVWAAMGMGKTSATLTALDVLMLAGEVGTVLVVAPLRVARTTWPEEVLKWNHLKHLRVVPIVGTAAERKAALIEDAQVFTINYENLPWLVSHWQYAWPYDTLVLDEATKLKSARILQGGKRAAELQTVVYDKVRRVVELTGTPAPNGLADLYGQMLLLDRGQRLGRTYTAFENRWFGFQRAQDAVSNGRNYVKRIAFPHAQAEIQALLKDICLTLDAKDWFPIDEPIVTNVYVDLPPDARRMYKNMEQELFAEIQGYGIEAFNPASKSIKCLAGGTEVLTDAGWLPIETVGAHHALWDGVEWVKSLGSVCTGYRSTVECFGVRMTPDHRVLTNFGWLEAQGILDGKPSRGPNRSDFWIPDRVVPFRFDGPQGRVQTRDVACPMRVRDRGADDRVEPSAAAPRGGTSIVRVQARRATAGGMGHPRHDRAAGVGDVVSDAPALRLAVQQGLEELRWAWHHGVYAVAGVLRRFLGRYGADVAAGPDARPQEQQPGVFQGQLPLGHGRGAGQQHPGERHGRDARRSDDGCDGRAPVRGEDGHPSAAHEARLAAGQLLRPADTERGPGGGEVLVYDILNAGPRHRFTVRNPAGEHIVVHNCLSIANGAAYTGSGEAVENDTAHWVEVHTEKLDALESIISESGGVPVLVAYHFKPDRDRILKRFPKAVHIKTKAEEAAFKAGHIEIGLVHAQSIGHGVDGFQNATNILIFFAHWWAMEDRAQLIERIGPVRQIQSGHTTIAGRNRPVMLYQIVARSTIDEVVLERLESKKSVQQCITGYMKRKTNEPDPT